MSMNGRVRDFAMGRCFIVRKSLANKPQYFGFPRCKKRLVVWRGRLLGLISAESVKNFAGNARRQWRSAIAQMSDVSPKFFCGHTFEQVSACPGFESSKYGEIVTKGRDHENVAFWIGCSYL